MNIETFVTAAGLIAVLQLPTTWWLSRVWKSAIKHEYDKKLEAYREEVSMRERAAIVAELAAEFLADPEDRKRLNQLIFELSLWVTGTDPRRSDQTPRP